jgi:cell wall assembly regulator SMI1
MKRIWDRIHVWLAANAPAVLASLRPGASDEAIRTAERAMGVSLPDDVKAAHRIHDGQGVTEVSPCPWPPGFLYGWQWFSLVEMTDAWSGKKKFVEGGFPDDWTKEPDGPVRKDWYHLAWIPLTLSMNNDHHCADLSPLPGGHAGQIITWWRDHWTCPLLAPNFTRWLERFADELDAGSWVWVDTDVHFGLVEASRVTGPAGATASSPPPA